MYSYSCHYDSERLKRLPKIVIAVILTVSVAVALMIFNVNTDDNADTILSAYKNNSNNIRRPISVSEIKLQQQGANGADDTEPPETPDVGGGTGTQPPKLETPSNWLQVCDACHKSMGMQGLKYVYGGSATISDLKGNKYTVRTDCSGYVSYCLYTVGLLDSKTKPTSQGFGSYSFTKEVPASDMQPGDLVVYPSHIDIFAGNGKKWNWGGHGSAEDKYVGVVAGTEDVNNVDSKVNFSTSKKVLHVYRVVIN